MTHFGLKYTTYALVINVIKLLYQYTTCIEEKIFRMLYLQTQYFENITVHQIVPILNHSLLRIFFRLRHVIVHYILSIL